MSHESARKIVVVGSGPAAVFAAIEAKRTDPAAEVTLLSDEPCEPYEKPPLSKAVLTGKAQHQDALIAGRGGIISHNVVLQQLASCTAINRAAHEVLTASGRRYPYDALVLATGCVVCELPQCPLGTPRVHYLRTAFDAEALREALQHCKHLVLIGGGLIGLEAAASARTLGVKTTVLEARTRILARVCDEKIGAFIAAVHWQHGVEIHTGLTIDHVEATDSAIDLHTKERHAFHADIVLVGAGVKPNFALAAAAGLAVDNGIKVDEHCRTSDPDIFAAGDAVCLPGPHGPVRLENWKHAQDQGMVAGRNAAGGKEAYRVLPSFWSEQYDLYIQAVGWPSSQPVTRVYREGMAGGPLVFDLSDGVLVHTMGINRQRDIATARRLIERRVPVDPAALADATRPLGDMLKARA